MKDGDINVCQYIDNFAAELGKPIKVKEMPRYEVGEGIERKKKILPKK